MSKPKGTRILSAHNRQYDAYLVTYQELSALCRRAARQGYNRDPQLTRKEINALIENKCKYHRKGDYKKTGADRYATE